MFAGLLLKPLILQYKKKLQLKIQFIKKLHILPRVQSKENILTDLYLEVTDFSGKLSTGINPVINFDLVKL